MSVGGPSGRVQYSYDRGDTAPSIALIEAIADAEGIEATDLSDKTGMQLGDYVDLDAVDNLETAESNVTIALHIGEYGIQIDGEEVIIESQTSEE
ncbi:HalOD1 output domain-containing protein [Halobellus sp. H-GB7]|uniref:HalOD1 output domain-containing protein n=1 Tax=Halobellus sp. H-GB7 TaxID=3069756 RepID=UPI0027B2CB8D|nr:HalOD1 output domain-containing protein [Halobellus sp. H-GB7]MDQ2053255.1 HalOD1 output domain-containing protein [Halobellus sp. H-GB7]